jgi:hypothetical protein
MKAEHIDSKTAQRSGERDGGLFYHSYSIAGRELRLMIFSDIAKCVWHDFARQDCTYC